MLLSALLGGWLLWTGVATPQNHDESLELRMRLDATEYVLDQPILFLLELSNRGETEQLDVAPLRPADDEFCRLWIEGASGPVPDRRRTRSTTLTHYPSGGLTLPPGGFIVARGRLLARFGTGDGMSGLMYEVFGQHQLGPGAYRVCATFVVHTNQRTATPRAPRSVTSPWVTFEVRPRSESEEAEFRRLWEAIGIQERGSGRIDPRTLRRAQEALADHWQHLPAGRFAPLAYPHILRRQGRTPDLALVDRIAVESRSDVRAAWALDYQIAIASLSDSAKRAWVEHALATRADSLQRRVLNSWRLKLEQRKFYTSYDSELDRDH